MTKKITALALVLVLCLSLLPVSALAADEFQIENGVLVKYNGKGGDVTIPAGVTEIGYRAFAYCKALTSVTIPDGVQTIGAQVFYGCEALTSVSIPDGVQSIGAQAFSFCRALTSVSIPDSVKSIGDATFSSCKALTSVSIPDGVQTIGKHTFSSCKALTSVSIPDSVQTIDEYAFSLCEALTSVSIPDSVKTIREGAFSDCKALTSVSIPDSVQSIGDYAFYGCELNITIPPSVTAISGHAIGYYQNPNNILYIDPFPYEYGHVTIHGQAGSAAEKYAKENNIKFVADWNGGTTEPTPTPEIDPVKKFTDVNAGDWFVNAVKYVLNKNLFKGTSGKTFEPNTTTNRAMFVVVLARGDGADQKGDKIWYDRDVQWAVAQGYYDGKDPEGGIPRQEMALILYRRAGSPEVSGDLSKYNDVSGVSGEMKDALVWAVQTGYLKGVGGGRLNPQGTATRAEVATIFMRVFG